MRYYLVLVSIVLICQSGFVRSESALPPIIASLEVDRENAFVKEQVLVSLRVGYPRDAFGMSPSTVQASNAELYPLSKSEHKDTYLSLPYRIVERQYALFANGEGIVRLVANISGASLPVSAGGADSTKNPIINAPVVKQDIAIRPALAGTLDSVAPHDVQWLAASDITISSEWSELDAGLHPGAPITRRIVVNVQGQHPAAVPYKLPMNLPDGIRAYPAPAITSLEKSSVGLTGRVVLPVTLVASDSGEFELPEISLPWWDINNKKWQQAILSPHQLSIVAVGTQGQSSLYKWFSLGLALLSGALGVVCILLWKQRHQPQWAQTEISSEKQSWRRLKQACKNGNDALWRESIHVWWRALHNKNEFGLERLSVTHPSLQDMINELDHRLYGKELSTQSNRKKLMNALVRVRKEALLADRRAPPTRGLYPESIHRED